MRLYVYVLQAKNLPAKDTYVNLQIGKHRSKTSVVRNTANPVWNEEFVFRVNGVGGDDEVIVTVLQHEQDPSLVNVSSGLIGRVRLPLRSIAGEENQTMLPTWFVFEKPRNGKFVNIDSGKILLSLSLQGKWEGISNDQALCDEPSINMEDSKESEGSSKDLVSSKWGRRSKHHDGKKLMKVIVNNFDKLFHKKEDATAKGNDNDASEHTSASNYEDSTDGSSIPSTCTGFEEGLELLQSRDSESNEMPEDLPSGVLIDQNYLVSPCNLNVFLFSPSSHFRKELAEIQGTTDLQEGHWIMKPGDNPSLTRVVTYMTAPTKLVKSVKATEDQVYVKANRQHFAVHVSVSTPDVPYGSNFKVELLYKIQPGIELPSGEETSQLIISWGIHFHQSTMMKGMIEGGARQGLRDNFEQFADLMAKNYKTLDSVGLLDKDQVLATLSEQKSDLKSAFRYFWSFYVICAVLMFLYVMAHILHCEPNKVQGYELYGIDLPDSLGELFTSGILVLLLERVYRMSVHFIQAKLHRGCDHGVKANGKGWILTIALIKGMNLASVEGTELFDPYVVFTCTGKTRTSSVKLQAQDPQWNEVIEFDAMDEPPSVLDVEVFDFDGPFDQGASLGHAEINFLKHTSDELADLWVPLEGNFSQASQSKLHLRIFLENNNGVETMKDYLTKVEKEVGKKLNIRSPQKNSAFQKLFGLPHEEFLLKEYTCQLKRKMPLQGKLFLSARIVAFYSKFFGHKTKFYFLWEDIDEIQVLPPTFSSFGSPLLLIILKKDRGLDAKHGAKSQDEEGRLWFCFQSFVTFEATSRTIMAIWKTRMLNTEHREEIAKEEEDTCEPPFMPKDVVVVSDADEFKMTKVYTCDSSVNVNLVMEIFDGGELERKIMEKSGCLSYVSTMWESVKPEVSERRISYKFNHNVSIFGGSVSCQQQKSPASDGDGWIVNEVVALHDVPFGDHFRVHLKYEIKKPGVACEASKCEVYVGIRWLKSTKFQQRITRNVLEKFRIRSKEMFELLQKQSLSLSS